MKYARPLIDGEPIRVHKNLNNGKWSVSAKIQGKGFQVVAHLDSVVVLNPTPKINFNGVGRIRDRQRRAVVAQIEGTYSTIKRPLLATGDIVSYNPYRSQHFTQRTPHLNNETIFTGSKIGVFAQDEPHFTI